MKRFRGKVKNNVVILEEDAHLPDGTEVDVCLPTHRERLKKAVEGLLANPVTRPVGIDELIAENKRELEER